MKTLYIKNSMSYMIGIISVEFPNLFFPMGGLQDGEKIIILMF